MKKLKNNNGKPGLFGFLSGVMQRMGSYYKRNRRHLIRYLAVVLIVALILCTCVMAFATNDPLRVVNNLSDFIFGLIRAVGMILLGWGIVQVGLSLQSHDPSQRSNGFLTLAGGIIITFAKEILNLIVG